MASKVERERSYEPGAHTRIPDLSGLAGVTTVGQERSVELTAVYFDTPALSLLRAGVTLRRRTGGEDEGWHLKIPVDVGREEIQLPLAGSPALSPPDPMREAIRGWTRGDDVAAVATLITRRTIVDLRDAAGGVLAQVVDDRVEGRPHRQPVGSDDDADTDPVTWREWEVELVDGDPELLSEIDARLASDGVLTAAAQVKLAKALGAPVPRPSLPEPGKRRPARLLLHRRLADQVAELGRRDSEIRRGGHDAVEDDTTRRGVHKARVACRRLRAALATFRPLVDREVTDPIRDELRWLAHSLGEARDLDVAHHRLRDLVDAEPGELVIGRVQRRLDLYYIERRRAAVMAARDTLDLPRYFALREQLDRLAAAPPWTERAEDDARDVLPPRIRREYKRLRRRVRTAQSDIDGAETAPAERDAAVHAARRAAKRLRYAAEAVQPIWGKDAARLAKAAKQFASTLGVRQDSVLARPALLDLAAQAREHGEDDFTYGLLHAREQQRADDIDRHVDELWHATSRQRLRAWL